MNVRRFALAAAVAATGFRAEAQQLKPLSFVRDTAWDLKALGIQQAGLALFNRDGRILVSSAYYNTTDFVLLDSAMKKQTFSIKTGLRGPGATNSEIGWIYDWGWAGNHVWVLDQFFRQIAILDDTGHVTKSIGFPSWVRPSWSDRRKYPLFADQYWLGVYEDGTTLVQPYNPRHLLDTPGYDRDSKLIVRIDGDGRILKTVASLPLMEGRFQLRSGAERQMINVPNYPRTFFKVSNDAKRVVVVTPIGSDSGAFRISMLDENGDTVFARRYAVAATRVKKDSVPVYSGNLEKAVGRYSVEQIRDTIRKLMPAFISPVANVDVGLDYSVWVSIRRPTTRTEDAEYFVVDAKGEPQGILTVLRPTKINGRSLNSYYVMENDRVKRTWRLIHFVRKGATAAPPSRTARAAASSRSGTPPE